MTTAVVPTRSATPSLLPTIVIPDTVEEAVGTLQGLAGLAFAADWNRAAIVYAFTEDQQGSNQHQAKVPNALGVNAFAALGVTGLNSPHSVRAYRRAWQWAMDNHGVPAAEKGQPVPEPPIDWSEYRRQLGISKAAARYEDRQPGAIDRILAQHPESSKAAAEIGSTLFPDAQPLGQFPVSDRIIDAINALRGAVNDYWPETSDLKRRHIISELRELIGDLESGQ